MNASNRTVTGLRIVLGTVLCLLSVLSPVQAHAAGAIIDIPGPPGSGSFGKTVTVLPNGNFVVTDPTYNASVGAVYLYNSQRVLISQLSGGSLNDSVGSGGVTVLTNGNFVVSSPFWDSGPAYAQDGVGAVTWCSQTSGCSGMVSVANSLVGNSHADLISGVGGGITPLANGNYVVRSPSWDNGSVVNAGAVTWGNGMSGTKGVVSAANSLVGSSPDDELGRDTYGSVTVLSNGNYLVRDSAWDNGSVVNAGAITWGDGTGGTVGPVSATNSLVGTSPGDQIGSTAWDSITELANGNYVVFSSHWDLDASHIDVGAVTWGSGTSGVKGGISPANSLVGTSNSAPVGDVYKDNLGVTPLSNGNYVVSSPFWSANLSPGYTGAVTWGSGTAGVTGQISASNSLVGSHNIDYVGDEVIALTNGNYVVVSSSWALNDANTNAGAVTWGNGSSGTTGLVSEANSLIGHTTVGVGDGGVIALANGNYAVSSPAWRDEMAGPTNVGAITWGNGTTGTTGKVSTVNSLVGANIYDSVGDGGLVALTNGNFVAISTNHFLPGNSTGTVTWVSGSQVTTGLVTAANSLVGSNAYDQVGSGLYGGGVTPLANGNYVVHSPQWNNGSLLDAGAVTWGNGTSGTTGVVSPANSLVGSSVDDQVGGTYMDGGVFALPNGNYVVSIPQWDAGPNTNVGAVIWGDGAGGTVGFVSAANSLVGSNANHALGEGSFFGEPGITILANGNYLVNSPHWSNGSAIGAVTWGDGAAGTRGTLSALNSLINTSAGDQTFNKSAFNLFTDGNASLQFPSWSDGSNSGAVSLLACDSDITVGPVSAANSVLGSAPNLGHSLVSSYDATNVQLIVGRPSDNKVSVISCHASPALKLYLPLGIK
jgi:hypothetical protein